MKFVVVGTSHYGYEVTQTLLKDYPESEIHLYERGNEASFLSCGIHSYLEGTAPSLDSLHYADEDSYKEQDVHIHVNADVVGLDAEAQTVTVETAEGQKTQEYDKLFLSPGALPGTIDIPGIDLENVYYMRGRDWAEAVKERMSTAKKAVVIGAGYIGVEAAEAYTRQGIDTTLIEYEDQMLPAYLDTELTDILEATAEENGLKVRTGESATEIVGENGQVVKVVTDQGEYEADTVILALGIKPNTDWLKDILDVDDRGFVRIDEYTQTSAEHVFAGGDATYIPYGPTGKEQSVALATSARRQGIVSAKNMEENKYKQPAVNGTSALPFFDYKLATTGLGETACERAGIDYESKYVEEQILPDFRGDDTTVHLKITYEKDNHKILGGQILSKSDETDSINVISTAITAGWTLEDMAVADYYFQPSFDRPWHYLNVLAQQALGETFGSDQMTF